jgi:hypothetical protein
MRGLFVFIEGGMGTGTSYSLPRTPEDFLSNVDEMDTQDTSRNYILQFITYQVLAKQTFIVFFIVILVLVFNIF